MCTICISYRPFDPDCVYSSLPTVQAEIAEITSSPANTSTTNLIAVGDVFSGALNAIGDDDWIEITLVGGTSYEILLSGAGTGAGTLEDPYLRLYNASGSLVAQNDDGGAGRDSRLVFTSATDGTLESGCSRSQPLPSRGTPSETGGCANHNRSLQHAAFLGFALLELLLGGGGLRLLRPTKRRLARERRVFGHLVSAPTRREG